MIIKHKKKICKKCGKLRYYWSVGLCEYCSPKTKYIYKRKPTGEAKLFKQIWKQRIHQCVNCKTYLGLIPHAGFFSHIIPKSRFESLRLNPNNIQLLCHDCHYAYDFRGIEEFNKRKKTTS